MEVSELTWPERLSEFDPGDPEDMFVHEARYLFAAKQLNGDDVLDVACGTGYGSGLLARFGAKRVVGVDNSPEAIEEARRSVQSPAVEFIAEDALRLDLGRTFDTVVSFETIEHVADPELFVSVLARHLRPGGTLVCSSPNRHVLNPAATRRDAPSNPFHLVELDRREFQTILRDRFAEVTLFAQSCVLPRAIRGRGPFRRLGDALYRGTAWPSRLPFEASCIVAVCRSPRPETGP